MFAALSLCLHGKALSLPWLLVSFSKLLAPLESCDLKVLVIAFLVAHWHDVCARPEGSSVVSLACPRRGIHERYVLNSGEMQDAGVAEQACECRFWAFLQQQCDEQRLSLDAGACKGPSQGLQHYGIRTCIGKRLSCRKVHPISCCQLRMATDG